MVKNPPANAGDPGLIPRVGKVRWRRAWQPTPVFLPGESHGQRSLAGYSPRGHNESDVTEGLSRRTHTHTHVQYFTVYMYHNFFIHSSVRSKPNTKTHI